MYSTPLEDCLVTEDIIYKMLYCYASADIKLNASSNWLCVFGNNITKENSNHFKSGRKKFENKFCKTAISSTEFPPYLFRHVDNMISTFCVVVLLNRHRTMAFRQLQVKNPIIFFSYRLFTRFVSFKGC